MTGQLQSVDDGDAPLPCAFCGRPAAGPCATCHRMVCGHCCTLTEGGIKVWAICLECDRKGGKSLRRAWVGFVAWLVVPLLLLAAVVTLLTWLGKGRW